MNNEIDPVEQWLLDPTTTPEDIERVANSDEDSSEDTPVRPGSESYPRLRLWYVGDTNPKD